MSKSLASCRVILVFTWAIAAMTSAQPAPARDLTEFSLEDLMNIQVTSVSKKEQKLAKTGAAIFVIDQEDIRHSGATDIPDLLRMAPGVDVARIDTNHWAISIRGFNAIFANKVLVLIDGRPLYVDSGSNVFWDQMDVPLEDINHIEVVRGPGGTVWGANAVNGVINSITKNAQGTQGGIVTAGGGSETSAEGLAQYSGKIGSKGAYHVFGRYFNVDSSLAPSGQHAADGWHAEHVGFRSDGNLSPRGSLTVQGDFFKSDAGQTITTVFSNALPLRATLNAPISNTAGNILGRWNRTLTNGSDTSLQVYHDYNHRAAQGQVDETHHKVDLDFSHHIALGPRNDLVWGLGYRFEADEIRPGYAIQFLPPQSKRSLFSTFVQDEIKLTDSVALTLGSKFEHNAITGFEYEPSAQLVWTPSERQTFWLSAARAIRQPSLADSRLEWRWGEFVEISVVGQNLLAPRHLEFLDTTALVLHTQVERGIFGKITWRF